MIPSVRQKIRNKQHHFMTKLHILINQTLKKKKKNYFFSRGFRQKQIQMTIHKFELYCSWLTLWLWIALLVLMIPVEIILTNNANSQSVNTFSPNSKTGIRNPKYESGQRQ